MSPAHGNPDREKAYYKVLQASPDALEHLVERMRQRLETRVRHSLHPASVLIDVPPRDKDKLDPFPVVFQNQMGCHEHRLGELSSIVAGVGRDMLRVVKKIRMFCDPMLVGELRGASQEMESILLEEILH